MGDWLSGFPAVIASVQSPIGLVALGLLLIASLAILMTNGLDKQWRAGVFLAILLAFVVVLLAIRPVGSDGAAIAGTGGARDTRDNGVGGFTGAGDGKPLPAGDYILPHSADEAVDPAMLANFSVQQLRLARNEIYARHGQRFTQPDTKAYFAGRNWYRPSDDDAVVLNPIEQRNIMTIRRIEASRG